MSWQTVLNIQEMFKREFASVALRGKLTAVLWDVDSRFIFTSGVKA